MHIRHLVAAGFLVVTAAATTPRTSIAQAPSELVGGWIVTSWTRPDGTVNKSPQRGLFLFTPDGSYSFMYVPGDSARPSYTRESRTEAEELASMRQFVANSGRYTVQGSKLSYEAYVAKDPNYMNAWNRDTRANAVTCEFSVANGILTLKWPEGQAAGRVATLRRAGTQ